MRLRMMLKERPPRIYLDKLRAQGSSYATLDSIPPEVREIFVTREDPEFYRHKGVLPKAILNAFKYSIRKHKPMAGGSTITQQMVKNLYFSSERTIRRKTREIALALLIEKKQLLTKDEILELYLNLVRYGPDVYGISDAAEFYFGKTPDALTRNQAVILASTAISPFWRRPIEDPKAFTKYRNYSLYELVAFNAMSVNEAKLIAYAYSPLIGLDPELRSYRDIYGVPGASRSAEGLVEYARAQVGAPYWKGAYGQKASLGLLNHSRWSRPKDFEDLSFLDDLGKRVFDEAGLIKGYLWTAEADKRPYHDRDHDWSCAGLYENATEKGGMDSFDNKNGRILYAGRTDTEIDHAGVYSSEGYVYHAKDRAHGVVREAFRPEEWSFWSGLPEYESDLLRIEKEAEREEAAGYQAIDKTRISSENSALTVYTALSPNHSGPRTQPISRITPHYAAGDMSVEVLGAMFADVKREASTNYGIGSDGRVALFVEEGKRSWASSDPDNDQRAVTIECANLKDGSLSDECWSSLVELCADICRRNGISDCSYTGGTDGVLTMHRWFAETECPGPWLSEQFERLSQEVNAVLHNMKDSRTGEYCCDFFIPLGPHCRPAINLRKNDLREFAAPLDWMGGYSLDTVLHLFRDKFNDFFAEYKADSENPKGAAGMLRVYDTKNNIRNIHHFPDDRSPEDSYPEFKEKMDARAKRLEARLQSASCIALIAERTESKAEMAAFLRSFSEIYPHLKIRLVNMRHDEKMPYDDFRQEIIFDDGRLSYVEYIFNDTKEGVEVASGNTAVWSEILSQYRLMPGQ